MTKKYTTYNIAAHWLCDNLVLCNNISYIDDSVYDNMRFPLYDGDGDPTTEIYQWYLTPLNESDVEYLEKTFGLLFTYSNKLDLFILCVDHWGTMWRSVPCEVKSDEWARFNKDLLITADNEEPEYKKQTTF